MTAKGENPYNSRMKCFIAIVLLSIFTVNNAIEVNPCEQIPQQILQTLKNASYNLTNYTFAAPGCWSIYSDVSLTSIDKQLVIDDKSIKCDNTSNVVNLTFEIVAENFPLDGYLLTTNTYDSISAHFQTITVGELILTFDVVYMKESKKLIVQNQPINTSLRPWSDFTWLKRRDDLQDIQQTSENWLNDALATKFPEQFNCRVNRIIFDNASDFIKSS